MAKACRTCKGRGRWQEEEVSLGETTLVWHECNDCHGTGVAEDDVQHDIGGDSYADED